jgi:hypothetical protein
MRNIKCKKQFFFFFFYVLGFELSFTLARQVLHHLSYSTSPAKAIFGTRDIMSVLLVSDIKEKEA